MSSSTQYVKGIQRYQNGDEMMMEVNMSSPSRPLHFFLNGKQQIGYVKNLPASLKFAVSVCFVDFIVCWHYRVC
jgi:hypothetical protein